MFNRETFVIVKCAVVVIGPGTDKQLPVPQFRGLEWRGGGFPSTCRPVSKTSLRGESLVGKRRWRKESVPKSRLRGNRNYVHHLGRSFSTTTFRSSSFFFGHSFFIFPRRVFSSVHGESSMEKGRWNWNGRGNEVGSEENRKSRDRDAVVPLLPAKIPLITWKELICVYSARLRGSKKKISTIQV